MRFYIIFLQRKIKVMYKESLLCLLLFIIILLLLTGCRSDVYSGSDSYAESISETANDNDSSAVQTNSYTFRNIRIILPDGFTVSEKNGAVIACDPQHPEEANNIIFSYDAESPKSFYSKNNLTESYTGYYNDFNGFDYYNEKSIDGYDAIVFSYRRNISGSEIRWTQYCIFLSEETEIILFTNVSGEYENELSESAESIKVIIFN